MRKRKQNKYLWLLLLLLGITVGYALISTTLKINGHTAINKHSWSVYWTNPVVEAGSVSQTPPTIGDDQDGGVNTKANWSVTLDEPGDYYEFTIDAVNAGDVDAMILDMTPSSTPALPDYIKYTVQYDDGEELEQYHKLKKATDSTHPTIETYRIRIEFLDTITPAQMNAVPDGGIGYTFSYEVDYSQADDRAIDKVPSQGCPGKKCIYAFYSGSPNQGESGYYYGYDIDIGDSLPLEFATDGPGVTANWNGGPTYNYKELKLEYDEYYFSDVYYGYKSYYVYQTLQECSKHSNNCIYRGTTSYQPKTFFGHILDNDGKVIQKFACLDHNNNVYCFDTFKIYASNLDEGYAAYNVFSIAFGNEWDENTKTGCKIYNPDNENKFSFYCTDGIDEVEYHGSNGYDHVGLNIYTYHPDLDVYINLHTDYLSGPETSIPGGYVD
jgi:hypothetical protein